MRRSILGVVLFASVAAVEVARGQEAVQWRVEDGGNGHWYRLMVPASRIDVDQALAASRAAGGDLVSITSASENSFVFEIARQYPSLWTLVWPGATQIAGPWIGARFVPPSWRWTDGSPWAFDSWSLGNPNYMEGEHAVLFMGYAGGPPTSQWNNIYPDYLNWGYVVEWSADCNADGIIDYGQCRDGTLADYNGNNIPDCCESGTPCIVGNYPVQWRKSDGGNGNWYRLSVLPGRRFWDLVSDAGRAGGYLVTIASAEENAFARSISLGYFVHFGAFHDAARPGYSEPSSGWRWVNGDPWTWTGWCPGQPDNAPWGGFQGQELARFNGASTACWDDAHSLAQIATIFIEATMFEWSADCNADGIVDYGQILQGQLADTNADGIPDVCQAPTCADADLFPNGAVNGADLGILLSQWGAAPAGTVSDLNRDGTVDGADLGVLLSFWGPCAP